MKAETSDSPPQDIQILADDSPGAASAAPDALAGLVQVGAEDVFGRTPPFWVGKHDKELLDKLAQNHPGELEGLKAEDQHVRQVRGMHKTLTKLLADSQFTIEKLEAETSRFRTGSIPETLYTSAKTTGLPLRALILGSAVHPSEILIAFVLQEHSEAILKLAHLDHDSLASKMREFRQKEKALLARLGLY